MSQNPTLIIKLRALAYVSTITRFNLFILAAGFGVCALSDFAPIARFGALSATAIVLAVIGDLFLLPALLSLTPRRTLERWGSSRACPDDEQTTCERLSP